MRNTADSGRDLAQGICTGRNDRGTQAVGEAGHEIHSQDSLAVLWPFPVSFYLVRS